MSLHRMGRKAQGKAHEEYIAFCAWQRKQEKKWRIGRVNAGKTWACKWIKHNNKWIIVPVKRSDV